MARILSVTRFSVLTPEGRLEPRTRILAILSDGRSLDITVPGSLSYDEALAEVAKYGS
jgi:hypothetical protein